MEGFFSTGIFSTDFFAGKQIFFLLCFAANCMFEL